MTVTPTMPPPADLDASTETPPDPTFDTPPTVTDMDDPDDATLTTGITADDAREFGSHINHGNWRDGLLVARNVTPGEGVGRPVAGGGPDPSLVGTRKVSARVFATASGTTHKRVLRHFKAWQSAADAGLVPDPQELDPGDEVELPDKKLWSAHYSTKRGEPPVTVQMERAVAKLDDVAHDLVAAVADGLLNRGEVDPLLDEWLATLDRDRAALADLKR